MHTSDAIATASRRTFMWMLVAATLAFGASTPPLLASVGLLGEESLQAWMTVAGMLLGIPCFLAIPVVLGFSIAGLVRGPRLLRQRIVLWWLLAPGGVALSLATASNPAFNPYLGHPQPTFGLSDAVQVLGFGLGILLPILWLRRLRRSG